MLFKDREADIFSAYNLFARSKYLKSLAAYEEFLAIHPDSFSALNMIGGIHLLLNETEKAESAYYKLIEKFNEKEQYDKSLAILRKLSTFSKDFERIQNFRHDLYVKKGRLRLANKQLILLAEEYRHKGDFRDCIEIYTHLADENQTDYRLIREIVLKLILISGYSAISGILLNCMKNKLFAPEELDDNIVFLLDSHVSPQFVIPFVPDFLLRNPSQYFKAEDVIIKYLRESFDPEFFNTIVGIVDPSDAAELAQILRDDVKNKELSKYLIYLEAMSGNASHVKGLVYEMYINNDLDVSEIDKVSLKAGSTIPTEESLKLLIPLSETKDSLKYLAILRDEYAAIGKKAMAESLAVYIRYSKVPENLTRFFSEKPEDPAVLEARFDTRTVVENTTVALEDQPAAETAAPEKEPEPAPAEPETIQLDSYDMGGTDNAADMNVSIDLSDDFGTEQASASNVSADVSGLESFSSEPQEQSSVSFDGFATDNAEAEPEQGFTGFDTPTETVSLTEDEHESTGDMLEDLMPEEKKKEPEKKEEHINFDDKELEAASSEKKDDFFSQEI